MVHSQKETHFPQNPKEEFSWFIAAGLRAL
jgi:hypothetical protein